MDKRAMDENSGEQSGQSQSWISTQAVGGVKVLPVPAGSHRIQIAYKPQSLLWGMAVFALSFLTWLGLLITCLKAQPSRLRVPATSEVMCDLELENVSGAQSIAVQSSNAESSDRQN